jgi:hypothetical protein
MDDHDALRSGGKVLPLRSKTIDDGVIRLGPVRVEPRLAKRRREHRIYLTELEASLLREQLLARAGGTSLVFPTVEGNKWTASRFRDRAWVRTVEAAIKNDPDKRADAPSIFEASRFTCCRGKKHKAPGRAEAL